MTDIHAEALHQTGAGIVAKLRSGESLSDLDFDSMYPPFVRKLSKIHWTPVDVAVCAAQILIDNGAKKILDVGCGPGKFCLIAAALGDLKVAGVDLRPHLLAEAKTVASKYGLTNVEFIHSDMNDLDWSEYDGFYIFNPFLENVCTKAVIDKTVKLNSSMYYQFVDNVVNKLAHLPVGATVVTYHGFGGDFPSGYSLENNRRIGTGPLECWVKVEHTSNCSSDKPRESTGQSA